MVVFSCSTNVFFNQRQNTILSITGPALFIIFKVLLYSIYASVSDENGTYFALVFCLLHKKKAGNLHICIKTNRERWTIFNFTIPPRKCSVNFDIAIQCYKRVFYSVGPNQ